MDDDFHVDVNETNPPVMMPPEVSSDVAAAMAPHVDVNESNPLVMMPPEVSSDVAAAMAPAVGLAHAMTPAAALAHALVQAMTPPATPPTMPRATTPPTMPQTDIPPTMIPSETSEQQTMKVGMLVCRRLSLNRILMAISPFRDCEGIFFFSSAFHG